MLPASRHRERDRAAIVETALGQNTPQRRPAATDGTLLPHVVTPEAVTEAVATFIRSGWGEVGVLPP